MLNGLRTALVGWPGGALLGALIASIGWVALFQSGSVQGVTAFDVFTMLITFVSIAANVIQWREAKTLMVPVRNPLIGLFNELKSRQQRVWGKQSRISDSSTAMEFFDFTEEVLQAFEQLREHVISLIETVSPGLPDEAFYRASTRGLDKNEKEMREIWIERRRRDEKRQSMLPEPAKTLFRRYEGNLEALIVRGFESGFEWTIEDKTNKAVVDDGTTTSLDEAKAQADASAKAKPEKDWRSR